MSRLRVGRRCPMWRWPTRRMGGRLPRPQMRSPSLVCIQRMPHRVLHVFPIRCRFRLLLLPCRLPPSLLPLLPLPWGFFRTVVPLSSKAFMVVLPLRPEKMEEIQRRQCLRLWIRMVPSPHGRTVRRWKRKRMAVSFLVLARCRAKHMWTIRFHCTLVPQHRKSWWIRRWRDFNRHTRDFYDSSPMVFLEEGRE